MLEGGEFVLQFADLPDKCRILGFFRSRGLRQLIAKGSFRFFGGNFLRGDAFGHRGALFGVGEPPMKFEHLILQRRQLRRGDGVR
ncbi:MAG: hypothetical protein OEU46_09520 [Alphaproteobacteria bacterium]|nr:hypothetical protein [Alphaproteobacteria bacterium]